MEEGDNELQSIYEHLECNYIEAPHRLENDDIVFVDEEGMLKECNHFFYILGAPQPYAGSGLILGDAGMGESGDAESELEEIKSRVKFLSLSQAINFTEYQL